MNSDIENVLYYRQKLAHNLDRIIESAKKEKSNAGQLSLFGEEIKAEVVWEEPENFNAVEVAEKEYNSIGFHLTYSPFDEFEIIRCRYCNSYITKLEENGEGVNNTMLVKIKDIEYKTSQYGNKYAKITFGDESGDERLYLSGNLYRQKISICFVNSIYLLTVRFNAESQLIEIVNFDRAEAIKTKVSTMWVECSSHQLPVLRMYLKSFLMGDDYDVNVRVNDFNKTLFNVGRVKIDPENLIEMRKNNLIVKLR